LLPAFDLPATVFLGAFPSAALLASRAAFEAETMIAVEVEIVVELNVVVASLSAGKILNLVGGVFFQAMTNR